MLDSDGYAMGNLKNVPVEYTPLVATPLCPLWLLARPQRWASLQLGFIVKGGVSKTTYGLGLALALLWSVHLYCFFSFTELVVKRNYHKHGHFSVLLDTL